MINSTTTHSTLLARFPPTHPPPALAPPVFRWVYQPDWPFNFYIWSVMGEYDSLNQEHVREWAMEVGRTALATALPALQP